MSTTSRKLRSIIESLNYLLIDMIGMNKKPRRVRGFLCLTISYNDLHSCNRLSMCQDNRDLRD